MKKVKKFYKWFKEEQKGNAMLIASATTVAATMGIFFFANIQTTSLKNRERSAHLYNASVMAIAMQEYINAHLGTQPYPKNKLLNNGLGQYTETELSATVNINNYEVLALENLEENGYVISHNDPTAQRELGLTKGYDTKASKIKIEFKLDENNKVESIVYLVNLAGSIYDKNEPYNSNEPFFYLVSFTDDVGDGDYGSYDLIDNTKTLIDTHGTELESILVKSGKSPFHEAVIILPGDNS